ncbi:MAG TPA: C4-dicarboxylate transporter DctA [Phycisphaerae bacterium]|nr:C4-dicarboxylate transporter DctA [Phycisphaerae bacterium]
MDAGLGSEAAARAGARRRPFYAHLYFQVVMGFLLGAVVGWMFPGAAGELKLLADAFIKLIRMVLAPVIFGTVVVGIAQMGSLKEVGRVGVKALLYFEGVTTVALLLGLAVVNVIKPGAGFHADLGALSVKDVAAYTQPGAEQTVSGFLMNIIPTSIGEMFVTGNMLQVIFFSVLFGFAATRLGKRGRPLIEVIEAALGALFGVVELIMKLAPVAAFGAMAFTVGKFHGSSLWAYGKLMVCLYITSGVFVFGVLGAVAWLNGISMWKFLGYIWDEILITFATASTEAVLPRMMEKMEAMGCEKAVVGLVLPAGYTFNADGGCIYMTMGALFLAQATGTHLSWMDQIVVLAVCLFTSKGSAGVAGAAFVALAATLSSMSKIPVASLVLLVGVDRFLNEARAVTNLIGNGIATVTVARWEGALDVGRARGVLEGRRDKTTEDTEDTESTTGLETGMGEVGDARV